MNIEARRDPNEELPSLRIQLGEHGEFDATPENSSIFTFLGKTAINGVEWDNSRFNHIFLQINELDEERLSGAYIFSDTPAYETLANYLLQNGYPLHCNIRNVAECDIEAFFARQEAIFDKEVEGMDEELRKLFGDS